MSHLGTSPLAQEVAIKLLLVEGLPGSGKTTVAQFVGRWLREHGQDATVYLEGNWDHPADFESVACLDASEYARLVTEFPAFADFLDSESHVRDSERFFSYQRLRQEHGANLPDVLLAALARYEIYELAVPKYRRLILQRWREFTGSARHENRVYVFECCFLQNPLTMLLGRNDVPVGEAKAFIRQIAAAITALDPVLIYLQPEDVAGTLARVTRERPQAWLELVIDYHTKQGYGKVQGWQGLDGLIRFYEFRQAIERQLLPQLPFETLTVPHSTWDGDQARIVRFLESRRYGDQS